MAAENTSDKIWQGLRKLRDDIPPPLSNNNASGRQDQGPAFYKDNTAFVACNEVRAVIGRCSELPRAEFLDVFSQLVAGPKLEELCYLFKSSRSHQHPALEHCCLLALHGVAELYDRRNDLLTRPDIVTELCAAMASPRQRVIVPTSAGAERSGGLGVVNSASGAVATITGLFTSNGTLEPTYAKLWVKLGAVSALASCLESHVAFDRADPVSTDLPLCFFLIATSLLVGAADSMPEQEKIKFGAAWLKVFAEATRWVAREAEDLLADFYIRPNWLKGVVKKLPEGLRARAVEAARACVREGRGGGGGGGGGGSSWKHCKADRLALALLCGNACCWDEKGTLVGRKCAGPGCARVQKCGDGVGGSDGGCGAAAGDACREDVASDAPFKRCSQCHAVGYCSRECQAAHWKKGHRKVCVALGA